VRGSEWGTREEYVVKGEDESVQMSRLQSLIAEQGDDHPPPVEYHRACRELSPRRGGLDELRC